jgi:hypothetical protein
LDVVEGATPDADLINVRSNDSLLAITVRIADFFATRFPQICRVYGQRPTARRCAPSEWSQRSRAAFERAEFARSGASAGARGVVAARRCNGARE